MIVRSLVILPVIWIVATLETSLGDVLAIGAVVPDLMATVAMIWVLASRHRSDPLVAGLFGLAADVISPGSLGPGMAAFALVAYGLTVARSHLPIERAAVQTVCIAIAIWLIAVILSVSGMLLGDVPAGWSHVVGRAAGVGLYSAAIAVPAVLIVGWLVESRPAMHVTRQAAH